jgi:glycosyltransferase involved in cell wall biosynthesis
MNQGIGIVSALNTGISNSSGIYIARLDADDCMSSDRLKIQVDFLKSNPHIGVVGSQVTYINEVGDKIAESRYLNGYVFDSPNSFKNCSIAHPSVMIRRDVLEKVGGYTSLLIYRGVDFAEDFFLWLRISKISLLFNLQDPLTYYRQHENQVSRSKMSITSLASLLVFIKSIDCQNRIPTPIHLEQIRSREKKLLYGPCLKKFDFPLMFLLHLKLLAAKDFNKQLSNGTNLLARLLSRIMGFSRPQN